MRVIGGLSKVTRHSDDVDLSRLKRVHAMRAAPFEGELLMLFSFVHSQPETASAGVQSAAQFPSRRVSSPGCVVNSTITVREAHRAARRRRRPLPDLRPGAFPPGDRDETRPRPW